jgi:hypothetical protein
MMYAGGGNMRKFIALAVGLIMLVSAAAATVMKTISTPRSFSCGISDAVTVAQVTYTEADLIGILMKQNSSRNSPLTTTVSPTALMMTMRIQYSLKWAGRKLLPTAALTTYARTYG